MTAAGAWAGPAEKARMLLALHQAQRDRDALCGPACKAGIVLMLKQAEREREKDECHTDLNAAALEARAEKRPLFVWVGIACDRHVRGQFPRAVHCHVDAYGGDATRRLLVGDFERHGHFTRFLEHEVAPDCVEKIQNLLSSPAAAERPAAAGDRPAAAHLAAYENCGPGG